MRTPRDVIRPSALPQRDPRRSRFDFSKKTAAAPGLPKALDTPPTPIAATQDEFLDAESTSRDMPSLDVYDFNIPAPPLPAPRNNVNIHATTGGATSDMTVPSHCETDTDAMSRKGMQGMPTGSHAPRDIAQSTASTYAAAAATLSAPSSVPRTRTDPGFSTGAPAALALANAKAQGTTKKTTAGQTQAPANAVPPTEAPGLAPAAQGAHLAALKTKTPRYPPIVVERLPDWHHHFKALKDKLGTDGWAVPQMAAPTRLASALRRETKTSTARCSGTSAT